MVLQVIPYEKHNNFDIYEIKRLVVYFGGLKMKLAYNGTSTEGFPGLFLGM